MQYDTLESHRIMVRDQARTEAYQRALTAVVRPGDVVLDVGAGSGILSLLAARAGARRVYAVEPTRTAALISALARDNGLDARIRVCNAPMEAVQLPEPVDVIVSEWMGSIGVDENLLAVVLGARDRCLRPGGRLIPRRVTAWMAPARLSLRPDARFFHERPYGLQLDALAEPSVHELLCYRRRVAPQDLAAEPQPLWTTDLDAAPLAAARLPSRAARTFLPRPGPVNCLLAWFEAELAEGVVLRTGPSDPDTHWGQLLLPLRGEVSLPAGASLEVRFTCLPWKQERAHLAWSVRAGAGGWEHHDTRCFSNPPPEEEGSAPMTTTLRQFLARLSIDHEVLRDFIRRPEETMREAGLSEADRATLRSRDQARIQLALLDNQDRGGTP